MPHCPQCLREYDVSGGYCPHDGAALKAGRAPTTDPDPPGTPTSEDAALARLRSHGVGVEDERSAAKEDYDRFLGTELDGRYKITRKLGEGGMGVVFFGRHIVIEKPVAIKVLKKVVSRDPSIIQRFIQEARAASRIGHPNIVDVTDFGKTPDDLAYQVMEYLEGPTLADLIYTRKRVPLGEALPIVAQMARALAAAHKKGIIHRDLKPENVFLIDRHGRTDFVKIVDFGIAKVAPTDESQGDGPRLTRAGSVFGTPEYMAPEQASGSSQIDARADIYALGAIFYEMLVGRVPLVGENTVRTLAMVILDPVKPPRETTPDLDIPEAVEAVLMKALGKKPDDRWPSMDAFADALEKAAGKKLSPRIGPGIGSLPPAPPPSSPGIALPQPDTVPDVEPAGMSDGQLDETTLDSKPTQLFEGSATGKPKRHRRSRKSSLDPAFVETARPGFDPIAEPRLTEFLGGTKKRNGAWIVALLALLGAGAAAGVWAWSSRATVAASDADAAPLALDAAALVQAPIFDAAVANPSEDAAASVDVPPDAAVRKVGGKPPPVTVPRVEPKELSVRVMTRPSDGTVLVDGMRRGMDGVTLTVPRGSELNITCKLHGHRDGRTRIRATLDGQVILCDMSETPQCVDGIKNPFGECPTN